jgi:hypothetical protein
VGREAGAPNNRSISPRDGPATALGVVAAHAPALGEVEGHIVGGKFAQYIPSPSSGRGPPRHSPIYIQKNLTPPTFRDPIPVHVQRPQPCLQSKLAVQSTHPAATRPSFCGATARTVPAPRRPRFSRVQNVHLSIRQGRSSHHPATTANPLVDRADTSDLDLRLIHWSMHAIKIARAGSSHVGTGATDMKASIPEVRGRIRSILPPALPQHRARTSSQNELCVPICPHANTSHRLSRFF